jgi:signal transduction histidine kinase
MRLLSLDWGVGVPQEDLDRVFDKFYLAAELGSSLGLGLGLAICKAFIEADDGRISLESNPMGGTIASLRLTCPPHRLHEKTKEFNEVNEPGDRKWKESGSI